MLLRKAWFRASFALGSSWLYILLRLFDWSRSLFPLDKERSAVLVDWRTWFCCSFSNNFLALCVSFTFWLSEDSGVFSVGMKRPPPIAFETP